MSNVALLALVLGAAAFSPSAVQAGDAGECVVSTESGVPPSSTDERHSLAACHAARASFAELFGEPVPGVRIILWEEPHYRMGLLRGEAAIFWPTGEAMTPRRVDPIVAEMHVEKQWREVLPHEIAHLLLAVQFFRDDRTDPGDGYGTPLPDWLDEAVAIWAEPPESRRRRIEQARELPDEYRDLRSILTRPHPAAGRTAGYVTRDGTARPADFDLWAFYPQSIAVLAFIHEHGGTEATTELVRRLLAAPDDLLPLAGLPGLPEDFEAVQALWKEWITGGARGNSES